MEIIHSHQLTNNDIISNQLNSQALPSVFSLAYIESIVTELLCLWTYMYVCPIHTKVYL